MGGGKRPYPVRLFYCEREGRQEVCVAGAEDPKNTVSITLKLSQKFVSLPGFSEGERKSVSLEMEGARGGEVSHW